MEQILQTVAMVVLATPPAAAFGLVPRLGPGRAIFLALSSFRPVLPFCAVASHRIGDVATLRAMLSSEHSDQYIVVSGPKGIGKSSIVKSALQSTLGVVIVRVPAGTAEEKIKADAFTAITRYYLRTMDQIGSARRVLWWHHFIFRTPVTVVLQAAERKHTEAFAALDSAARALTQDFGARVVIDASNNSLPDAATATKREKLLEVEPMARSQLEQLLELKPLYEVLKAADLMDVVWACVGGNPADYKALWGKWKEGNCSDIEPVVAAFVQGLLGKSLDNVCRTVAANKRLQDLYDMFRFCNQVPSSVLKDLELVCPSPDKVLRAVRQRTPVGSRGSGAPVLIPADAATALVLKFKLEDTPSLEELKTMLRK